mgnify:CR=1 FL=1
MNVIIKPIITEKTSLQNSIGKYSFEVKKSARKATIRKEFEALYGIKASDIKTQITTEKVRSFGRKGVLVKRESTKRALISVEKGKTIDQFKIKQK